MPMSKRRKKETTLSVETFFVLYSIGGWVDKLMIMGWVDVANSAGVGIENVIQSENAENATKSQMPCVR